MPLSEWKRLYSETARNPVGHDLYARRAFFDFSPLSGDASILRQLQEHIRLEGSVPSPLNPPSGCRFRTRCPYAMDVCAEIDPPAYITDVGTTVYCHLHTSGPMLRGEPLSRAMTVQSAPEFQSRTIS